MKTILVRSYVSLQMHEDIQSQIHCRDVASTSRQVRKGSGEIEGHKEEQERQLEKWGRIQTSPFSGTFAVPLCENEPSLFVVGFSCFKG